MCYLYTYNYQFLLKTFSLVLPCLISFMTKICNAMAVLQLLESFPVDVNCLPYMYLNILAAKCTVCNTVKDL